MSRHHSFFVECDVCARKACFSATGSERNKEMEREGWKELHKNDYCPQCQERLTKVAHGIAAQLLAEGDSTHAND